MKLINFVYDIPITIYNAIFKNELILSSQVENKILQTDANNNIVSSVLSDTSLNAINGLTSDINIQLNERLETFDNTTGSQLSNPIMYIGSAISSSSTTTQINFPTPFPNGVYSILVMPISSGGRTTAQVTSYDNSSFSFEVRFWRVSSDARTVNNVSWLAIGY
jgi:hypothetical protein